MSTVVAVVRQVGVWLSGAEVKTWKVTFDPQSSTDLLGLPNVQQPDDHISAPVAETMPLAQASSSADLAVATYPANVLSKLLSGVKDQETEYAILRKIGAGTFGTVYKSRRKGCEDDLVIKIIGGVKRELLSRTRCKPTVPV
jgi:serine/threonine protein kinase